jgi:predicted alpha/beta hydrolase family esterase
MTVAHRVLLLPGWLNSNEAHWQSRWQALHGHTRVEQDDWLWPRRGDWMARLDEVLLADAAPTVLAGHSLGCQLVAAWAAHSSLTSRVQAALLVAPPDTERADMPPNLFNWRPIVHQRLPFASTLVYTTTTRTAPAHARGRWRRPGAANLMRSARAATSMATRASATGRPAWHCWRR